MKQKKDVKTNDIKNDNITDNSTDENIVDKKKNDNDKIRDDLLKFKDMYLRTLADYKNLENRVNSERQNMRSFYMKEFILELLPFIDNLDQAMLFNKDQGLQMISQSFMKTLSAFGLSEVELKGSQFDPKTAEVIDVVEGKNENEIVEILQKAYALNGVLIRHAKVKVSKKNS